jgi:hypothetical protein
MSSTHGNLNIKPYILYNQMSPNCTYSNMSLSSPSIPFINNESGNVLPRQAPHGIEGAESTDKDVKLLGHFGYGHFNYPYWGYHGYRYGGYYGMPYYGCYPYRNCWRWSGYY